MCKSHILLRDDFAEYAQEVSTADLSDLVRGKASLQHCIDNDVVEPGRLVLPMPDWYVPQFADAFEPGEDHRDRREDRLAEGWAG